MPLHHEVKLLNLSYFWQQYIIYLLLFNGNNELFLYFTAYACFLNSIPFGISFNFWSLVRIHPAVIQNWEHLVEEQRPCYMSRIWGQGWEVWPSFRVKEERRREGEREKEAEVDESDLSHPVIKGNPFFADITYRKLRSYSDMSRLTTEVIDWAMIKPPCS